jgi:hypothetical protein
MKPIEAASGYMFMDFAAQLPYKKWVATEALMDISYNGRIEIQPHKIAESFNHFIGFS